MNLIIRRADLKSQFRHKPLRELSYSDFNYTTQKLIDTKGVATFKDNDDQTKDINAPEPKGDN